MNERELTVPTNEQIEKNATLALEHGYIARACWYPQMGGYAARCWVVYRPTAAGDECFEAYVYHDGEFPFDGPSPAHLHHCSSDQFVHFGRLVEGWLKL